MRVNTFAMLVPEAATNFDYLLQPWEYQIWLSWKRRYMQPVAVAHTMYQPAHFHFRRSILAAYAPHVF
jgi:hypothetical protein